MYYGVEDVLSIYYIHNVKYKSFTEAAKWARDSLSIFFFLIKEAVCQLMSQVEYMVMGETFFFLFFW